MDASGYKKKLKALFDKLFSDNFQLSEYHSENLLKHLDGSRDKGVVKILETPFFADLLISALKNDEHASISVRIFITKLVNVVLHNEVHFNRFVQMQGFQLLIDKSRGMKGVPAALVHAYVRQLMGLTAHYFGVKYAFESKIYDRVLKPYDTELRLKPPEVMAGIHEFSTKLIWKLNEYEEEDALLEILQVIVNPLMEGLESDSQGASSKTVVSSLHALVHILGEVEHLVVPNNVVSILSVAFPIEKVRAALEATREPALARLLAELALRYCYAMSRQAVLLDPESEGHVNLQLYTACNKIVATVIQKRSYETILKFLSHCHAFWHRVDKIGPPIAFEKFGKRYLFQSQFLLLVMVPVFVQHKSKRVVSDPSLQDANEVFHSDLAQTISQDGVKLAYDLRDLILESEDSSMVAACACAVQEVLGLRGLLSRPQACVVFQALYYALSEYVLSESAGAQVLAHNPLRTPADEHYLACILDGITMLLDEHEIYWYESLEIIDLQAALMNLIKQNILPMKHLVQAVELITLSVRKLLSPELSLLMESRGGGSLREVAGAARALLVRSELELRVAALQLLLRFTEVAYVKFVPLRNVISSKALVVEAARCALGSAARTPDARGEARARALALRCLTAASKCEDLWLELLAHYHNLYEQLFIILQYNPEGEVRKEAASVLCHVYINHRVTDAFTCHVSRAMARAATEDAHWPVQVAALNYWEQVTKKQFSDRGMIDGTFPSVTFCKEKRKIIVLNDKEIHKQLEIFLGHMSTTGCLAVLLKCMEPHNNREVIEKAHKISSKVTQVLDYYKYSGDASVKVPPQSDHVKVESSLSLSPGCNHSDLISEIFECFGLEISRTDYASPVEVVNPSTFLVAYREAAKRWNSGKVDLGTLIDELLEL